MTLSFVVILTINKVTPTQKQLALWTILNNISKINYINANHLNVTKYLSAVEYQYHYHPHLTASFQVKLGHQFHHLFQKRTFELSGNQ